MQFVVFLLSSQLRISFVSAAFDFKASLNDVVPVSPMLLSIGAKRNGKSELLMDVIYVSSFVFTFQIKFSECCV